MRLRILVVAAALAAGAAMPSRAAVLIAIDKSSQQMTVSVDGVPHWQWPVSTGRSGYDTPNGRFRAFRMEADHYSKEWDNAPMPHSIFFTRLGHAIHGYLDTRNIGNPASHGCVRLEPANAARLFALVQQQGVLNTTVVLTGTAARRKPRAPQPGVVPVERGYRPVPLQPDYYRQQLPPQPYGYRPPQSDVGPLPHEYRVPQFR